MRKLLFLLFASFNVAAQFPSNDGTWELKKEDQFNSLISNDWFAEYPWGRYNGYSSEYNDPANLIYSNSWLKITSNKFTPPWYDPITNRTYDYSGGCTWSKFKYKYGYFEASIKTPIGRGYWPAYWVWDGNNCGDNDLHYDEIDIHERGGDLSETSSKTSESHHWFVECVIGSNGQDSMVRTANTNVYTGINNCALAHKYSLIWQQGRMAYYIDDQTVHSMNDQINTPSHSQALILNFAIDPWTPPNNSTLFPNHFEIDYIKIYQLKTDCAKVESICTFNKSQYALNVKKEITFGGTSCSTNINTSDGVSFWAKDFIILDKNTTLTSNGSGYLCFNTYNCSN